MKKYLLAGLCIGALVGIIIGLSISEVVGIVLGALTSLLASFFGFKTLSDNSNFNPVTIISFSISCIFFVLVGIFMRTHNLLSPSISSQIKEYKDANFNSLEIKKIILFKNFGILDKDQNVINGGKASIASGSTVLMSADSTGLYLCDEINESSSLIEIKRAFIKSGLQYQRIVEEISNIVKDEQEEKKIYLALSKIICKRKN